MSFFKRLFSSDHRAAKAAEAAGDFELAAQRYALAGQFEAAVRMHWACADRAQSRQEEINALRNALHWSQKEAALAPQAKMLLGKALFVQSKTQGIETQRDREQVREAAELLLAAAAFEDAGNAFFAIEDNEAAATAYRDGGLVAKMEHALNLGQREDRQARQDKQYFADYHLQLRGGNRDMALQSIGQCIENADGNHDYHRLQDELSSRLITGSRVTLRTKRGKTMIYCAAEEVLLGRDSLCDLVLRTGGVSRQHAIIAVQQKEKETTFLLRDAGSRNGTQLSGATIASALPLRGTGIFQLGTELEIHFTQSENKALLYLHIKQGLDKDKQLLMSSETQLLPLSEIGSDAFLYFKEGRPYLKHPGEATVLLNQEKLTQGDIQLIHGDQIIVGDIAFEVE